MSRGSSCGSTETPAASRRSRAGPRCRRSSAVASKRLQAERPLARRRRAAERPLKDRAHERVGLRRSSPAERFAPRCSAVGQRRHRSTARDSAASSPPPHASSRPVRDSGGPRAVMSGSAFTSAARTRPAGGAACELTSAKSNCSGHLLAPDAGDRADRVDELLGGHPADRGPAKDVRRLAARRRPRPRADTRRT